LRSRDLILEFGLRKRRAIFSFVVALALLLAATGKAAPSQA
jgi:hypothetical protein